MRRVTDAMVAHLSFTALRAFADASVIDRLRAIARSRGGYDDWQNGKDLQSFHVGNRPGRLADAVIRGAEAATDERLAAASGNGSTSNGHPCGFWSGMAVLPGVGRSGLDDGWPALGGLLWLFENKPALRNSILRRAAQAPGLTDAARIILVANLDPPSDEELRSLGEIWDRSIRAPLRTIDVPKAGWGWEQGAKIRYNFRAVAVAYAWGRYGRKEELLRAWTTAPPDDPVLHGELAFVMAQTGDSVFREQLLAYVREAWTARVTSALFEGIIPRELTDGRWLLDIRQQSGPHRWRSFSSDGGRTWSAPIPGEAIAPVCCGVERFTARSAGAGRDRILWTGPKGPGRANLVVRVSHDEGRTFPHERAISTGPAAYSDLTCLRDGTAGVPGRDSLQRARP